MVSDPPSGFHPSFYFFTPFILILDGSQDLSYPDDQSIEQIVMSPDFQVAFAGVEGYKVPGRGDHEQSLLNQGAPKQYTRKYQR